MLKRSAWLGVYLCVPALAVADQLELSNGDTIKGKIVSLSDGTMLFKSPVLGELKVPMKKIKRFTSDEPIKLQLVNGDVLESTVASDAKGVVQLSLPETSQPQRISVDQIEGINLAPVKPVRWRGKMFAGVNVETGNTKTQETDVDIKATRETEGDRLILDMRYEEDRQEDGSTGDLTTSKRYYALGAHYDYFLSERVYVYGDTRVEREPTANLDQRLQLGSGVGYQWIENTITLFETESGLTWVSEKFVNDSPSEEYAALRLATNLTHILTSNLDFFNNTEWLLSLEDQRDQLFFMDTGLVYRINSHLSLEAKMRYDWDKSPSEGNGTDDFRYVFGVSWGF